MTGPAVPACELLPPTNRCCSAQHGAAGGCGVCAYVYVCLPCTPCTRALGAPPSPPVGGTPSRPSPPLCAPSPLPCTPSPPSPPPPPPPPRPSPPPAWVTTSPFPPPTWVKTKPSPTPDLGEDKVLSVVQREARGAALVLSHTSQLEPQVTGGICHVVVLVPDDGSSQLQRLRDGRRGGRRAWEVWHGLAWRRERRAEVGRT